MARIAVGGFLHETNTFAPDPATYREFEKHDGWPGLVCGTGRFDAVAGSDLGVSGFVEAARAGGHDLVPLTWCSAEPCAHVTEDAFERIASFLCDDLAAQGPFDAVYLDLSTAPWSPNITRTAKARSWAACVGSSAPTCRWSRASTSTPTSPKP